MKRAMVSTLLAVAAVAAGCGIGENGLDGSLSEVFSLDVTRVHVLRNQQALAVSYEANSGRDIDLVLRMNVALDGIALQPGKTYDLKGSTDGGVLRASFVHNAAGEPARILPRVSVGSLTVDKGGNPGQDTSGTFSVSFVSDGSYGSGRGVTGNFHAVALDGGYDDWIP